MLCGFKHPDSGEHFMRQCCLGQSLGSDSNFEGWLAFQQKRGGTSLRKGTKKLLGCVNSLGESVSGLCVGKQREKRLNRETVAILWVSSNVQPRNFIHPFSQEKVYPPRVGTLQVFE